MYAKILKNQVSQLKFWTHDLFFHEGRLFFKILENDDDERFLFFYDDDDKCFNMNVNKKRRLCVVRLYNKYNIYIYNNKIITM